ncbi:MAG: Gfo/Idh/MocA family protein [Eubacteriales bacterium]|jgi:predicted dehydrogenase
MQKLALGIIGAGNMGWGHTNNIMQGLVPEVELRAVCDIDEAKRNRVHEALPKVELYETAEQFFENAKIEAVLIATPHYSHPVYAIEAFKRGLNVLTEKPAGVYTKAVRQMNEAAEKSGKVFGIMYNQRTNPVYQKVRELIAAGELGEIKRTNWIITNWYRSQAYYNSGGWRATWSGEGGGVLLNQDPHQLDLWQWMCGMPTKVRAFMQFGKGRDIEVENDVTAYVEYANGATGLFVTSTHETPGTNRFEVSGDMGKLVVENGKLTFDRNRVSEREFNATSTKGGMPEHWLCEIPTAPAPNGHAVVLSNFANACLKGDPLLAPGIEGIRGLTISNAMHLSAWTDTTVDIATLDEDLYYELLQKHIRESKFVKADVSAPTDGVIKAVY